MKKIFILLFLIIYTFLFSATYTWQGPATGNWEDLVWDIDGIPPPSASFPGVGDIVIIGVTSDVTVNVVDTASLLSIQIDGILRGTKVINATTVIVNGTLDCTNVLNATTVNVGGTGTFNGGTANHTITTLNVAGNTSLGDGTYTINTLKVDGSCTAGTGVITVTNAATGTGTFNGGAGSVIFQNNCEILNVNAGTGILTVNGGLTGTSFSAGSAQITVVGNCNVTTLNTGTNSFDVNSNAIIGTFNEGTAGGTFGGNFSVTTFINNATGTLTFDTTNGSSITGNNQNLGNIVISSNKICADNFTVETLTINADFSLNAQTLTLLATPVLTSGTLQLAGGTIQAGSNQIVLNGTVLNDNSSGTINCDNFNVISGSVNASGGATTVNCAGFSITNGSYNLGTGSISATAGFSVTGGTFDGGTGSISCQTFLTGIAGFDGKTASVTSSGNVSISNANTSSTNFTVTGGSNISASTILGSLTINNNNAVTLSNDLTLNNILTVTSGTLTTGDNSLNAGSIKNDGTIDCSSQTAGKTVVVTGSFADSLATATSGTFIGGVGNVTINGNFAQNSVTATKGILELGGNFTAPTFTHNSGTTRFIGNSILNSSISLYNIEISATATLIDITNRTINVYNNWVNNNLGDVITETGSTVNFLPTEASVNIEGSSTFNSFIIDISGLPTAKTVNFIAGTTQTVSGQLTLLGASSKLLTLTSSGTWNLDASATQNVSFVNFQYCEILGNDVTTSNSKDGGNNDTLFATPHLVFSPNTLRWIATATDTDWTNEANWNLGFSPNQGDNVTIENAGNPPSLSINMTFLNLTLETNAIMNASGFDITATTFSNEGTLCVTGTGTLTFANDTNSGTIEYLNGSRNLHFTDYFNLSINSAGTISGTVVHTINGNLSISSGTFDTTAGDINIIGNVDISAGVFSPGNKTVNVGGNWNNTIPTGFTEAGSTVVFNGITTPVTVSAETWNNITIEKGAGTITATGIWDVNGAIQLTSGVFNPGNFTHTINGSWDDSGITFNPLAGTILFDGAGTITQKIGNTFFGVQISAGMNLGADLVMNGILTVDAGFIFNTGTFKFEKTGTGAGAINGTVTGTGDFSYSANIVVSSTGVIESTGALLITGTTTNEGEIRGGSGTKTFNGNYTGNVGGKITGGTGLITFNSLYTANGSSTLIVPAIATGSSAVIFKGVASFNTGTSLIGSATTDPNICFEANVVFSGTSTLTQNDDIIVFQGGAAQQFTSGGLNFGSIKVDKTVGTVSCQANVTQSLGATLELVHGTLGLNGNTWNLGADFSHTLDTATLNIGTGTFNAENGGTYFSVSINGGNVNHGTGTLNSASLSIIGSSDYILSVSSIFNIHGNFTLTNTGTWTANSGDVTMYTDGSTIQSSKGTGLSIRNLKISNNVSVIGSDLFIGGILTVDDTFTFKTGTFNFTKTGTGAGAINGTVTGTGGFTYSANIVVSSTGVIESTGAGNLYINGTTTSEGEISGGSGTKTFNGAYTGNVGAIITGGTGLITFNSLYSSNNTSSLTVPAIADNSPAVIFKGAASFNDTASLIGTVGTNPNICFEGNVVFGTTSVLTQNGDIIVFQGGAAQNFTSGDLNFGSITMNKTVGTTVTCLVNHVTQSATYTLNLSSGRLLLNGRTWNLGANYNQTTANARLEIGTGTFTGGTLYTISASNGNITQGIGTLEGASLSLTGTVVYTATGNAVLNVNGNGTTGNATFTTTGAWNQGTSTLNMKEDGDLNSSKSLYNLVVATNKKTTIKTSNLVATGNLTTNAGSELDFQVGSLTLSITGTTTNDGTINGVNTTGLMTFGPTTNNGTINGNGKLLFNSSLTSSGTVNVGTGTAGQGIEVVGLANFTGGILNGCSTVGVNPLLIFRNSLTLGTFTHNYDVIELRSGTFTTNNQNIHSVNFTTGSVNITGNLNVQKDMTLGASSGTVTPDSQVAVWGLLTISGGTLAMTTINLTIGHDGITPSGLTITGAGQITHTANNQTTTFTEQEVQTITTSDGTLGKIVVNKTAGTLTLANASVNTTFDSLDISNGTFIQNRTLTLTGVSSIANACVWDNINDNLNSSTNINGLLTIAGTGQWNITSATNSKTVTLGANIQNAGSITYNGNSGTKNISILSNVAGTQRNWLGAGTFLMNNVTVRDQLRSDPTPLYITHNGISPGIDNGNNTNWLLGSTSIAGTLYSDRGTTTVSAVQVGLVIHRATGRKTFYTSEPTAVGGAYTFNNISIAADDLLTLYRIDEDTTNTITKVVDAPNLIGVDLYKNYLIIRSEGTKTISNTDLINLATVTGYTIDTFPIYSFATPNVTLDNDRTLLIHSDGEYIPGGNVTTSGTGGVVISGILTAGTSQITVANDWERTGIFNHNASTIIFVGTQASEVVVDENFYNLTINKTALANTVTTLGTVKISNDLTLTSGAFLTSAGNIDVDRHITFGNNASFTPGNRYVYCGGNWNGTAGGTFNNAGSTVVFDSDNSTIITSTATNQIFNRLLFRKGTGAIAVSGNVTASYLGAYRGAVTVTGVYAMQINGDCAILGAGNVDSDVADNWAGPAAYVADSLQYPATFSSTFNFGGSSGTLSVTNDFYVNGADMIGTSNWTLTIPDNDDDIRKARAYGEMNVSYSQSNHWVSASGGTVVLKFPTDALNNDFWDFGNITITEFRTVSDKVFYIEFDGDVENDNDEILTAFTDGSIKFHDNAYVLEGTFIDVACTNTTDGKGDLASFYIKVPDIRSWNTDAIGSNAGTETSTDRDGKPRTIKPNISFSENSVIRKGTKNRMPKIDVNAEDYCPPVLLSVELDDTITRNNGGITYKFNSIKMKFSEPLLSPSLNAVSDFITDNNANVGTTGFGGAIDSAGTITGWGALSTVGNIVTHSSGGTSNANAIFRNTDRTEFTFLLGGNYNSGGCIRSIDGTALIAPTGTFTPSAMLRDCSTAANTIDTTQTKVLSGAWTLNNIPKLTETKTGERSTQINGRIDIYTLTFDQDIQIFDGQTLTNGLDTHTISAVTEGFTHNYIAEDNNISKSFHPLGTGFVLNMIEIPVTNYGDTGELPLLTYRNSSRVKFISASHRLEMGDNHNNSTVRVDDANPVIIAVNLSIDDPDENYAPGVFNSSPYFNHITQTYSDPGGTPDFDMHRKNPAPYSGTTVPFTQRTYHNKATFTFSENLDLTAINIPLNPRISGYIYSDEQKSANTINNFGNSTINGSGVYFAGLGSLGNCNLNIESGSNFVQFQTERELHIHLAGWYDTAIEEFPGAINSATIVPRSTGTHSFDTAGGILQSLIKDDAGNSLRSKTFGGSSWQITISKDWDISKPKFRYIAQTALFAGDPVAGETDLSSGISGGNPVDYIEFIVNKAILDFKESTDLGSIFPLAFSDDNSLTSTPPLFTTGIAKLGKWTNLMEIQADTDSNDQGFSLKFSSRKPDYIRLKWSYSPSSTLYIKDLRGNKMEPVTEQKTIETAPPFIIDTRSVVNSNKMYVSFNEDVLNNDGNPISISDFEVITTNGLELTSIQLYSPELVRKDQYIFSFNMPLSDDIIVADLFKAKTNSIKDSLDNIMKDNISYKLSSIGINFFYDMQMEDYYRKGEAWMVKNFDGSEKITPDSLKLTTSVDVLKYSGMIPLLYYDIFDNTKDGAFWFPSKNKTARQIVGRAVGENRWEFLIPANDPAIKIGSYMSMVFKIGDFYSYRSIYPVTDNRFTPKDAETHLVKIETFKEQTGGVTILNNIINPLHGDIVKVSYSLQKAGPVSIIVYDLAGNVVKDLTTEFRAAGQHLVDWDGRNIHGKIVARGVYLVRVRAPGIFNQIRKVLVVK